MRVATLVASAIAMVVPILATAPLPIATAVATCIHGHMHPWPYASMPICMHGHMHLCPYASMAICMYDQTHLWPYASNVTKSLHIGSEAPQGAPQEHRRQDTSLANSATPVLRPLAWKLATMSRSAAGPNGSHTQRAQPPTAHRESTSPSSTIVQAYREFRKRCLLHRTRMKLEGKEAHCALSILGHLTGVAW